MPNECKVSDELLETEYILCNASFDEAYDYLHNNRLDGVLEGSHCWGKKIIPIIYVRYEDAWDDVKYKHFNTISYKIEYKEWENVTLKWIMEKLPANVAIQYLKERGITTCPMNF